jgi:hypothetical protein
VVAGTVQDATTSYLALAFWKHHWASPLYLTGSKNLLPNFQALFKAYDNKMTKIHHPKGAAWGMFESKGTDTTKL